MPQSDLIATLIDLAIREDIGDGDHTSLSTIPPQASGKAGLLVKQNAVIAGVDIALQVFDRIDPQLQVQVFIPDGTPVKPGDVVLHVQGNVRSILQAERLVLNIMQRMSGIATRTREYVDKLHGLKTRVIDTRKTTPGMRMLDKMAVRTGGGANHRIGLYDMVLIKDNHVDYAGGIIPAITAARQYIASHKPGIEIEIEVRNFSELQQALDTGGVQRIMLDNFTVNDTRKAVEMVAGRVALESSGGITIDNLRDYALCGVDYISVGALTHQIQSIDLSLKAM